MKHEINSLSELGNRYYFPIEKIAQRLSSKEALRIAYVPIIITNAAIRYIQTLMEFCAANRLPYRKEVRALREHIQNYKAMTFQTVSSDTYQQLEKQTDDFFQVSGKHVLTLWAVLSQELRNKYPELHDNRLYTNVYTALSLMKFVRDFQAKSEKHMSDVCREPICSAPDPNLNGMRKNLLTITEKYVIGRTEMIDLAIKVISNQVDKNIFNNVISE